MNIEQVKHLYERNIKESASSTLKPPQNQYHDQTKSPKARRKTKHKHVTRKHKHTSNHKTHLENNIYTKTTKRIKNNIHNHTDTKLDNTTPHKNTYDSFFEKNDEVCSNVCADCQWSTWETWGTCSKSCGGCCDQWVFGRREEETTEDTTAKGLDFRDKRLIGGWLLSFLKG